MSTNANSSSGKGVGSKKNPNSPEVFSALPGSSALEGPKEYCVKHEEIKKLVTIKTSL